MCRVLYDPIHRSVCVIITYTFDITLRGCQFCQYIILECHSFKFKSLHNNYNNIIASTQVIQCYAQKLRVHDLGTRLIPVLTRMHVYTIIALITICQITLTMHTFLPSSPGFYRARQRLQLSLQLGLEKYNMTLDLSPRCITFYMSNCHHK